MRKLFDVYQYVAPVILTPLGYWLWLGHYAGDHRLAALAIAVPVAYAYIVPGIGTNLLGVWEFDARVRVGRFRPHHGFVFGSATAILVWPVFASRGPESGIAAALSAGFVTAAVLGFWNWIYDIAAIRAGVLKVYNQPWADGRDAASIAADYAPIFFGGFGFVYGAGLVAAEHFAPQQGGPAAGLALAVPIVAIAIAATVLPYVAWSHWRHGHSGCRPVERSDVGQRGIR